MRLADHEFNLSLGNAERIPLKEAYPGIEIGDFVSFCCMKIWPQCSKMTAILAYFSGV
jgi:hypothetical protein